MDIGPLITTFAVLDMLSDDPDEGGQSKFKELLLPLVLCGCMGSGQPPPIAGPPAVPGSGAPTYVTDNSNQLLTILAFSALLRRRSPTKGTSTTTT